MRQISARQTISLKRRLDQNCECRIRLFGETLVTVVCKNAALNANLKHSRFFLPLSLKHFLNLCLLHIKSCNKELTTYSEF